MSMDNLILYAGYATVASPLVLLAGLGVAGLFNFQLSERAISWMTQSAVWVGFLSAVFVFLAMLATGSRNVPIDMGDWVHLPEAHFHFHLKFIFDRLSVPFVILCFVLCGVVGAFTRHYLHRETGYRRFFFLYAIFLAGMVISALAGTIETLFFGWEMVGLSSALLIAYFQEHRNPVRNGQRVWSVYRLADAAFLIAALTLHHLTGEGDLTAMVGAGSWPEGQSVLTVSQALLVGGLLIVAAAGKSGLVPFSGWLPKAMEGPTPSSAVFYGALSVHLGAYLLLRVSPILHVTPWLSGGVILLGATSAICGAAMSRVQSDVKCLLAYASLTQVGMIVTEIGLGWNYLALIHIVGHAVLRTLQLLRAPSLIRDYQMLENAMGLQLDNAVTRPLVAVPSGWQTAWYRFGYERGYFDQILDSFFVNPFLAVFKWSNRMEQGWTQWLSRECVNDLETNFIAQSEGKPNHE